jgi:hypothetical protein
MRITIPDTKKPLLEKQMAKAGYKDPAKYLLSLVDTVQVKARRNKIDQMLLEALQEPASPMTKADWDWVRREGKRMLARRKSR